MTYFLFALLAIPFVVVLARSVLVRRLATRHTTRRPVEAVLVIVGSLLGTAIITGSFVVGDTITRSIRAVAYDQLGPIDETVTVPVAQGPALRDRLSGLSSAGIDGTLAFTTAPAAVVATGHDGGTQPRAQLLEVDFPAARRFGGDPSATGISGPTPTDGRAAVTADLADRLGLEVGSRFHAFAGGGNVELTVDRVLPRRGVAGFWPIDARQQSYNVLVAPGTIGRLVAQAAPGTEAEPPRQVVAISNRGGVEQGAANTATVTRAVDRALAGSGARVEPVKQDVLDRADKAGRSLSQLYFTIGMFAVAAGILLLVNVFVMLADERRSELGMLRAVGMRRRTLVAALATEGWIYAVLASALGALLGIAFGRLIAWRADTILTSGREVNALHLTFEFDWSTVFTGFAVGLAVSTATILLASIRIARVNIIQAIRDITVATRPRPRRRVVWLGAVAVVLGALLTFAGFSGPNQYGVMAGPMLVIVGLAPWLARHLPARSVYTWVSVAVIAWAVACFVPLAALDATIEIPLFLVQGLALTAAAVYLVTAHLDSIGHLLGNRGSSLAARLGLAYPLARRFRTAMTLGMFAIIVLTLVYMSEISFMFRGRTDDIARNLSGGFGVELVSNPNNPVSAAKLAALPGVTRVAPLGYTTAEFTTARRSRTPWPATGIGTELADAPPHLRDRGGYATDRAAWAAVARDPNLMIIDDFFLQVAGGPAERAARVGDRVVMRDPQTGRRRAFRVAAIAENDFLGSGAFVSRVALGDVFGDRAVPSRFYVAAANPDATVRRIRADFVGNGADADTVHSVVATAVAQNSAFFTLMQQFVGAGLLIAVAGVGVIMFRAVRERRREVGVLRSLGFQPHSVARTFVFEAGVVATLGVALGVVIAIAACYVLAVSGADFAAGFTFGVPVVEIAVIVAIALVPALLAALLPARMASHIEPARALRIHD
ncbi:MAG TPA: FtsX-like permease family protein [Acidimicrobiia bacterium]|nr:FtsX-like permease family protein [Acidimicrobiia bacterium]